MITGNWYGIEEKYANGKDRSVGSFAGLLLFSVEDRKRKSGVGVISLSEPFNTETKEGRMMRNNLLNFAEFERETIAARAMTIFYIVESIGSMF